MEKLFLGIKGHVLCLNKETGEEFWRTKIKASTITNVLHEGRFIFAYAGGHFFCLNSKDGSIVWENGLDGMGYGPCIIASENQGSAVLTSQAASQQVDQQAAFLHGANGQGVGDSSGDGGD